MNLKGWHVVIAAFFINFGRNPQTHINMNYDPRIHHRHSIRLKGYDYSRAGLFFITICAQDRLCLFGCVMNGKMVLNDSGLMIKKWYYEMGKG